MQRIQSRFLRLLRSLVTTPMNMTIVARTLSGGLVLGGLTLVSAGHRVAPQPTRPPNIVIILADDDFRVLGSWSFGLRPSGVPGAWFKQRTRTGTRDWGLGTGDQGLGTGDQGRTKNQAPRTRD